MKLWRFFEKTDIKTKEPILTALTTDKDIADAFRIGRNMEKFYERIDKFYDEDEIDEYIKMNRGAVLRYETVKTYLNKNTNRQTPIEVEILLTEYELMSLMELAESGVFGLLEYSMIRPDIFSDNLYNALKYIDYVDAYKLLTMTTDLADDDWDIPDINWNFDMLGLFMMMFDDFIDSDGFIKTVKYKKRDTD